MDNPEKPNENEVKLAIIKAATEIVISKCLGPSSKEDSSKLSKDWQILFDAMSEKLLK